MDDEKRRVRVYDQDVILDTSKLYFSENTLSEYLEKEGGYIDYIGAKLADAEKQLAEVELKIDKEEAEYDRKYAQAFTYLKSTEGGSDKLTEGKAKLDTDVAAKEKEILEMKQELIEAKHGVRLLQQHLKAWQINHENAQNRGNTLRREMDRLNKDVIYSVDGIIKEVDAR
jgi:chromosome segregation ATPase